MTETDLKEIRRLLNAAKRKAMLFQEAENAVFAKLDEMGIDPYEVPTEAENADRLSDAITCWLGYDEYTLAGLMAEIQSAYNAANPALPFTPGCNDLIEGKAPNHFPLQTKNAGA